MTRTFEITLDLFLGLTAFSFGVEVGSDLWNLLDQLARLVGKG